MVVAESEVAEWWDDPAVLDAALAEMAGIDEGDVELGGWDPADVDTADDMLALAGRLGPCAESVALVAGLADRCLSAAQWLSLIELWQPLQAWAAGQETAAVAAFAAAMPPPIPTPGGEPIDRALPELAAALDLPAQRAREKLHTAKALHGVLSDTGAALSAGRIDAERAGVLVREISHLDDAQAEAVQARVLPKLMQSSVGNLLRRIRRAVDRVCPEAALARFAASVPTRRVLLDTAAPDGMVSLVAELPPVEGLAVHRRLEQLAGRYDRDDGRSKDQRMADALVGCVLGFEPDQPGRPAKVRPLVRLTMDLPTLLGLQQHPAELHGYGPLPADVAAALAGDADWQRLVHDPVDGHLLDLGTVRYRPNPRLDELVRARDVTCRFPGQSTPAEHDDLDHAQAFDRTGNGNGGSTSADDLAALSRPAHRWKTFAGFTYTIDPDGTCHWTTPLGRRYTTRPHDYRPDEDDPP